MIIDDPQVQFVMLFSSETYYGNDQGAYIKYKGKRLTNKEFLEHWGKWIVLDEKENLEKLAAELDPCVEQGIIPCCKYDRMPLKEFDMKECVFCVFCDDREKDEIAQILASFGATSRAWVPEKDVILGWAPGGVFLERWIEASGYEGEMAEAIREDARRIMEETYGDEDAVCYGWNQWGASEY
ncbi:MAG: hypothetical protein IBX36_03870 [Dehalococcoidia bacterium]|nr:hypothetical protein [Dehalococcoidia bacterium]